MGSPPLALSEISNCRTLTLNPTLRTHPTARPLLPLFIYLYLLFSLPAGLSEEAEAPPSHQAPSSQAYSICDSTNPDLVGTYTHTHYVDSAPVWTNDEGMGIWRHFGYWYIGDYSVWPPVTFYRCVVGCEQGTDVPPLTGYKPKKGYEGGDVAIVEGECDGVGADNDKKEL